MEQHDAQHQYDARWLMKQTLSKLPTSSLTIIRAAFDGHDMGLYDVRHMLYTSYIKFVKLLFSILSRDKELSTGYIAASFVLLFQDINTFRYPSVTYASLESYILNMGRNNDTFVSVDAVPNYKYHPVNSDDASSQLRNIGLAVGLADLQSFALCDDKGSCTLVKHNGVVLATLGGHHDAVSDVLYIQEKQIIITFSVDGTTRHWQQSDTEWNHIHTYNSPSPVLTAACSTTQRLLYTGDANGNMIAYPLDCWTEPLVSKRVGESMVTALCRIGDAVIVTGCSDGSIMVWNVSKVFTGTIEAITRFVGHRSSAIRTLSYSPSYHFLAATCGDRHAYIWDTMCVSVVTPTAGLKSVRPIRLLSAHGSPLVSSLASSCTPQVITADIMGSVRVWDWRYCVS